MKTIEDDLGCAVGDVRHRRGDERVPHVHSHGLDASQLPRGEGLIVGVQAGLLAVVGDVLDGGAVQVAHQRDIAVTLGHGLFVDAQVGDDAAFLGVLAAFDRPFHDVPGLIPSNVEQSGPSQDVGFEQHIDGMVLEGDGEPRAGQCPGDTNPPEAMNRTSDSGEVRMNPGPATAVIEVPRGSGGGVIAERRGLAAHRASEGDVPSMGEVEVDSAAVGIENDAVDAPGVIQGQEP